MSGTASMGKWSADQRPTASKITAPSRIKPGWRMENSRILLIMIAAPQGFGDWV